MRSTLRASLAVAVALALGLSLGACSSGGNDVEEPAPATTAPPSTLPSTPRTTSNDPYCRFLQTFNDRFGQLNVGLAQPQQLRTVMQDASSALKSAQASAPENLRADLATLGDAFQRLIVLFEQVNYDVTKLNLDSLQQLQAPQFVSAAQRIDAYTRQNCL
jgi:Spy/CpxP family protein refolding chaperone